MNLTRPLIVVLAFLPVVAVAQTQRTGDSNARAMQQLQQLTGERTQLKAENEKLKQEVEGLKKQLASSTSGQSSMEQRLKTAEANAAREAASSQQNAEALEKLRGQAQELVTRFRETAQTLKEVESDRADVRQKLQVRDREFATCVDRNVEFYKLNIEVLDRFDRKGVWSSISEKEPFTRIQRTRLENLIDEYRDRAAELQLEKK